ncbi:hypothetical protein RJT34_03139 [Clitoria ternatea]|uniref:Uncharacterized protein n=1 Tax=Clitoria ternatea TaxID=43366 RepID=A0AAN9Q4T5_CLITE
MTKISLTKETWYLLIESMNVHRTQSENTIIVFFKFWINNICSIHRLSGSAIVKNPDIILSSLHAVCATFL